MDAEQLVKEWKSTLESEKIQLDNLDWGGQYRLIKTLL